MTFQFLCPQGHLLEGDEAHMGMQCECPQCGTAFIIPTIGQPAPSTANPGWTVEASTPEIDLEPIPNADDLSQYESAPMPAATTSVDDDDLENVGAADDDTPGHVVVEEALLHIPCPNGHELETPLDMIGQRVMCPQCGAEFRLRREKSFEYLRQQEILDRRRGKFWFQLAVLAAGFVVVVLLAMIVMTALR